MPTPRPIMTPIVDVKSGMLTTLESRPVMIEPDTIPARATPIGSPIASTEPNAMIKITIANPMPERLRRRHLELGEGLPTQLDPQPVDLGHRRPNVVTDRHRLLERGVRRRLELGVGDPPGVLATIGDLGLVTLVVRAGQRLHAIDRSNLFEERLDHPTNLGILDPIVRLEHDVADLARTLAAELVVEDVDAPLALDIRQREIGAVTGAHRPHHRSQTTIPRNHTSRTRRRRRKHTSARRFNMTCPFGGFGGSNGRPDQLIAVAAHQFFWPMLVTGQWRVSLVSFRG